MRLQFAPYKLKFKSPAGTSRGVMHEKDTCFIKLYDERNPEIFGIGEAAVFPGLSTEANETFVYKLVELLANVAIGRPTDLSHFPSIQFGFEQALRDFSSGGKGIYFGSPFITGSDSITINGLVWMGAISEMLERLEIKISEGFKCIKLKIGGIAWKEEIKMLEAIRSRFDSSTLEIRVDANGGFRMENVFPVLGRLADFAVSSIEQPIPAGIPELMAFVCKLSPVPVALDEELIGKFSKEEKSLMLDEIKPQFIVLKPALCGGFSGASEWIDLAEERGIGWWITSALESNVGLNALAQWVGELNPSIPQGLGTGNLFTNNFESPLYLEGDKLRYNPKGDIPRSQFDHLEWRE